MPRAYVVGQAWHVEGLEAALAAMRRDDFDPARVVVLEDGSGEYAPGTVTGGTASILQETERAITITVEARAGGWLVLTDAWYPGWQATLDGESVPLLRANGAFRAVRVPEGRHSVAFTYRPRCIKWGAALSLLGVAVSVALIYGNRQDGHSSERGQTGRG
jgi:hypothetical protein